MDKLAKIWPDGRDGMGKMDNMADPRCSKCSKSRGPPNVTRMEYLRLKSEVQDARWKWAIEIEKSEGTDGKVKMDVCASLQADVNM